MAITLRFYEELNEFLPRKHQKRSFSVPHLVPRSVKDLIEAQGIPHTEVDLILINGESASFEAPVHDGDRISVYPVFESLDISAASRLGRPPLRTIRFVADVHLGKLARRLRLLGFDCMYDPNWNDEQLAEISATGNRVLLSRDAGLLKRTVVTHGVYIHSDQPAEQMREVIRRLNLQNSIQPLSRCLRCNGELQGVEKQEVASIVPETTFKRVNQYLKCASCGRVYWKGAHWPRLKEIIRQATGSNHRIE